MLETEELEEVEEADFDDHPEMYVEKTTRIIYEVRPFEDFVLIRPMTPQLFLAIKKLTHVQFAHNFEVFHGDRDEVREIMWGAPCELFVEAK